MTDVQQMQPAWLAGAWKETAKSFPVVSPFSGEVVANVADCGEQEARLAADQACQAFSEWRGQTAFARAELLERWYQAMLAHDQEIARLMAQEMGKPVSEGLGEVRYAASFLRWFAEEAKRVAGEFLPSQSARKRLWILKQPVGPVYAITPWNFPAAMVTRKVAPALAAGCSVILKPAEESPLTALYLARLWAEVGGLPAAFQVLPASDPAPLSRVLMADSRIRKLTFTGSTDVGLMLYQEAAKTLKRVSLELGGGAPVLVFDDADLDAALSGVLTAKFRNVGQSCVAANRIYVQRDIYAAFSKRYAELAEQLKVGDPLRPETQIGPLVSRQAVDKVKRHLEDALDRGATLLTGGRTEGLTVWPTVLADVPREALAVSEETFGPLAPLIPFGSEEEAVQLANRGQAGLAAYVWTRDLRRTLLTSEALEFGIVGVNDGVPSTANAPFGGVKFSGLGREGGHEGIAEYLETKFVSIDLP